MFRAFLSTIGVYKLYEKWLWHQVKNGVKPEHIAIILDGNRRWASEKRILTLGLDMRKAPKRLSSCWIGV